MVGTMDTTSTRAVQFRRTVVYLVFSLCCLLLLLYLYHAALQILYFATNGTKAPTLQGFPLGTAINGASACAILRNTIELKPFPVLPKKLSKMNTRGVQSTAATNAHVRSY